MSVTTAQAIANYQSNPSIGPQVVIDSAANVTANLDGLETLASADDIVSITSGTPTLTITAIQLANDAPALERIGTPFSITPTGTIGAAAAASIPSTLAADLTNGIVIADTAANVTANLNSLDQLAISNELAFVTDDWEAIATEPHRVRLDWRSSKRERFTPLYFRACELNTDGHTPVQEGLFK